MSKHVIRTILNVLAKKYHDILTMHVGLPGEVYVFDKMVSTTADMLEEINPNFDRDRFFKAVYHPGKEQ